MIYLPFILTLWLMINSVAFGQTNESNTTTVIVPVQIDHMFIRQIMVSTLFTGPNETMRVFDDGSGCNYLELSTPQVSTMDHLIRIKTDAKARFGQRIGQQCLILFSWNGQIESFESLFIENNRPEVKARVVQSNLLNNEGQPALGNNILWQRINQRVHPQLESVVLDLTQIQTVLRQVLPTLLNQQQLERIALLVNSLSIVEASINEQGATISFAMNVPNSQKPIPPLPETALTHQELQHIDLLFQALDSFITLIVKQAAGDTLVTETRQTLLGILLDVRHDIIIALQTTTTQQDPVREIFLDTWQRLAPLLRQIARRQKTVEQTVNYLSFVTAADALKTIDAIGTEINVEISSDGLKRLARILVPHLAEPLQWQPEVDDQLREIFGFEPLSPTTPSSWQQYFNEFFIPSAMANTAIDPEIVKRLNKWIPKKQNLATYLPLVDYVLRYQTQQHLNQAKLNQQFHSIYHALVPATAWQESCWRQFVNRKGKRVPLQSGAGAVGIMQIVPRIWRGFYHPNHLKWDIIYNIRAGSEILMRYLQRYAIRKKEHIKTGNLDNLARATYAAYNAGPRKLTRYRQANATARQKRVDKTFYERFIAVKQNRALEVAKCY